MEIVELTSENIDGYLDQCLGLQSHLVSSPDHMLPEMMLATAKDSHTYLVAIKDEEKLAGLCAVSKMVHPVNITGYINNIVVSPEYRGRGLFSVLMDAVEGKAKEWGCTDLALTCSREPVKPLYEKRDYTKKETSFYTKKI